MRCTQLDSAKEVIRSSYSVLQGSQCCREKNSVALNHGIFTLYGNGTGTGTGNKWKVRYHVEMGQGPGFIICYCASSVPCTGSSACSHTV